MIGGKRYLMRTVVAGHAKVGGVLVGIVAVETQMVMKIILVDPGHLVHMNGWSRKPGRSGQVPQNLDDDVVFIWKNDVFKYNSS
ncbi:acetyl-CoA carboxylase 1-like protein [Tanacetum coccineum]